MKTVRAAFYCGAHGLFALVLDEGGVPPAARFFGRKEPGKKR